MRLRCRASAAAGRGCGQVGRYVTSGHTQLVGGVGKAAACHALPAQLPERPPDSPAHRSSTTWVPAGWRSSSPRWPRNALSRPAADEASGCMSVQVGQHGSRGWRRQAHALQALQRLKRRKDRKPATRHQRWAHNGLEREVATHWRGVWHGKFGAGGGLPASRLPHNTRAAQRGQRPPGGFAVSRAMT